MLVRQPTFDDDTEKERSDSREQMSLGEADLCGLGGSGGMRSMITRRGGGGGGGSGLVINLGAS